MDTFINLKKWLGINDNLYINNKDNTRGIYSTKHINENDIILHIPINHIITVNSIENDMPILKSTGLIDSLKSKNAVIALYLVILDATKNRFWKPYLDSIPTSIDHVIYYNKSNMAFFKNTTLLDRNYQYNYYNYMELINNDFDLIYKWVGQYIPNLCKNANTFRKLYLKFRALTGSRVFSFNVHGDISNTTGLVPYADLFNHSDVSNTTWYYNNNTNEFELKATNYIPANTQIYDSYGSKNNYKLFSIK